MPSPLRPIAWSCLLACAGAPTPSLAACWAFDTATLAACSANVAADPIINLEISFGDTVDYAGQAPIDSLFGDGTLRGNGTSLQIGYGAFGGQITGPATLVQSSGSGGLMLYGDNSYKGGTQISGGLEIGNGLVWGSLGEGTVLDNGELTFARMDDHKVANDISGSGSLTQAGTGRLVLTGNNSYGGFTQVPLVAPCKSATAAPPAASVPAMSSTTAGWSSTAAISSRSPTAFPASAI